LEQVKILDRCIENPRSPAELREKAVVSLAFFRTEAPVRFPPVRGLIELLNDSSPAVRLSATNALLKIAPEVLKTNAASHF
jgi:HEAT repeat protein